MAILLHTGNYQWMSSSELEQLDFRNPPSDETVGHIFECDLILPEEYHECYQEFPIWPERTHVELMDTSVDEGYFHSGS